MVITTLELGFLKTNCYIAADPKTRDCVVVDPGGESHRIQQHLMDNALTLRAILLTHAHADHVRGMWPLYEKHQVPVYIHQRDLAPLVNIGPFRFVPTPSTVFIQEGEVIHAGSLTFQVLECPGHTPGGVAYLNGEDLFTGDTLLHATCGRIDFPCSCPKDMVHSLAKLKALPGDFRVYPGHGAQTTLEYERKNNPSLQPGTTYFEEPEEWED